MPLLSVSLAPSDHATVSGAASASSVQVPREKETPRTPPEAWSMERTPSSSVQ